MRELLQQQQQGEQNVAAASSVRCSLLSMEGDTRAEVSCLLQRVMGLSAADTPQLLLLLLLLHIQQQTFMPGARQNFFIKKAMAAWGCKGRRGPEARGGPTSSSSSSSSSKSSNSRLSPQQII
ncbi:hypothetical protein ACSSS7_006005 [Eimeria intestinalis]